MPKLAGNHSTVAAEDESTKVGGVGGCLLSETGRQGVTIDASPEALWLVKRLWRRQGTASEGWGGDVVLLFFGRHTPAVAKAEAKMEVCSNSEKVK